MVVLPLGKLRVWHDYQVFSADANVPIVQVWIVIVSRGHETPNVIIENIFLSE